MKQTNFENQRNEIFNIGNKLLSDGTVKAVLAFAESELEAKAAPRFFRSVDEWADMKWDDRCTPNLARYLAGRNEKTAIVAKPCDARAIAMYMVEKQVDRSNIYIIGVECSGMTEKDGISAVGCSECEVRIPPVYDILVNNSQIQELIDVTTDNEQQNFDIEKRLDRFQNEMKKCILCFACRQACYGCYCKTCFMEKNIPDWLPADIDIGTKMTFHLGRAMHLAGRCVECGACERACPSGVKVRYLVKEITAMCRELYGYAAGIDPDEVPALAHFNADDKEVGFLGGEDDESCCNSKKQNLSASGHD